MKSVYLFFQFLWSFNKAHGVSCVPTIDNFQITVCNCQFTKQTVCLGNFSLFFSSSLLYSLSLALSPYLSFSLPQPPSLNILQPFLFLLRIFLAREKHSHVPCAAWSFFIFSGIFIPNRFSLLVFTAREHFFSGWKIVLKFDEMCVNSLKSSQNVMPS